MRQDGGCQFPGRSLCKKKKKTLLNFFYHFNRRLHRDRVKIRKKLRIMHRSKTFLTTNPQANIIDFIDCVWYFSVINNKTVKLYP